MSDSRCVACRSPVEPVLDLGLMPLADELFPTRQASLQAKRYPLEVGRCEGCYWVQLLEVPDRTILFGDDYPYFSSVSDAVCQSAENHAKDLIRQCSLEAGSFIVEIASNDGYQLKWFRQAGMNVLGIDPAPRQAKAAVAHDVPSIRAFFDARLADELRREYGQADVVLAKNVFAHVTDPRDFLAGLRCLLKPGGIASLEFPYLGNLLRFGQFDTIYHEHASYLSIQPLDILLQRCNLGIESITPVNLHGGSLRVDIKVGFDPQNTHRNEWLERERHSGINQRESWRQFASQVERQRQAIRESLREVSDAGLTIAAYGAAAKGVTLLNTCQLDHTDLEFAVDRNDFKVGKFLAGTGIEIKPIGSLHRSPPDVLLLLAWNHVEEIRRQQRAFESGGGRFMVPIPWPELVGNPVSQNP